LQDNGIKIGITILTVNNNTMSRGNNIMTTYSSQLTVDYNSTWKARG